MTAQLQVPVLIVEKSHRRVDASLWALVVLFAILLVAGFLGPLLVTQADATVSLLDRLKPPGSVLASGRIALLGTDALGHDLLVQILPGLRTSLIVASVATIVAGIFGTLLGVIAGYSGKWIDAIISRIVDIEIVFPAILLAIVIAGLFGPSILNLILILAATRWIVFTRVARAQTLTLRERDWVQAARVLGVSRATIIRRHILPFLAGSLATVATLEFAAFVMAEASLSYLGIGLPISTLSLGRTISDGRDYIDTAWWISTFPGLVLVFLVVIIGLLGDRLAERYGRTVDQL